MLKRCFDSRAPFWVRLSAAGLSALFAVSVLILVVSFFADETPETVVPVALVPETPVPEPLPDFDRYEDIEEKKQAFFSFLIDYAQAENERINDTRMQVDTLLAITNDGTELSPSEQIQLQRIAVEYRLDVESMNNKELLSELSVRVDNIPPSLVLAQAASESAWGTSRFAKEGNNIFGQWCYDEGCGLVPERRALDAEHEVRAFSSIAASVRAYFRNINTNAAYSYFRELRRQMRERDTELDAMVLAYGLMQYSERRHVYVNELQELIRINRLQRYDND
ncbi:MAG: glucosaminidase domain-containing protein [Pseudomonadales bacterium]|nr:glucosaminidase domain-containing protein [Pseudomonadales bacterium]